MRTSLDQIQIMSRVPLTPKIIEVLNRRYAGLKHPTMRDRIFNGRAIDLSLCEQTAVGDYILDEFVEDMDYVDCFFQAFIGSIGRVVKPYWAEMEPGENLIKIFPPGVVLASWSQKFWCDPRFECLFVRQFAK